MLKSLLPEDENVNITNDEIKLRSKLTTNKTMTFTKKSFFYTVSGFNPSHLGPLTTILARYIQKIAGTY